MIHLLLPCILANIMAETLALGRAKRATAGNRMQALLDQAHNDEDDMFQEVADDTEFTAPKDVADVFMEDFEDTDDEANDEEREEREAARAAKAERKGTQRKTFNPLAHKPVKVMGAPTESMDAPTALLMAKRRAKREELRQLRDQTRRAGMRASTLKTDKEVNEREQADRERLAKLPKTVRTKEVKMTQDQHIAAALETEELNKAALRDWLAREEERRELRKVVRKRVRGPRMSWVSRTVGGDKVTVIEEPKEGSVTPAPAPAEVSSSDAGPSTVGSLAGPSTGPSTSLPTATAPPPDLPTGPYTRNYLVLSNIPGGLPAELSVILGNHVDWSNIQAIPGRNRPLKRRPTTCPFTGLPARYRHPSTLIPYANAQGYRAIEMMLKHGFVWDPELGAYLGAEKEQHAAGVETVEGWQEAVDGGWHQGKRIVKPEPVPEPIVEPKKRRKRN